VWQFNLESAQLRFLFLENASLVASRAFGYILLLRERLIAYPLSASGLHLSITQRRERVAAV